MIFQTAMAKDSLEKVFRVVVSSVTKTSTITAASVGLGQGMPLIRVTAIASASVATNYVQKPVTATTTDPTNNLFLGILDHSLGTSSTYLSGEDLGIAQVYGFSALGKIAGQTASGAAGMALIPDLGYLLFCGSPSTHAAATGTAANAFPFGLGGLAYLAYTVDTVSATDVVSTTGVFLRCL